MHGMSEILFWGGGSVAFTLLGLFICRKFFKPIDVHGHAELLIAIVTIVGTLVSVLLGLLVSSAVDQYHSLESSIDSEATSVADIYRISRGMPEKFAQAMQPLCIDYCELTVKDEWPAMKHGELSPAVTKVYSRINDQIVGFRPENQAEASLQQSLLKAATDLGHSRRERIVAVTSTWIDRMLPILSICAFIVLAISYLHVGPQTTAVHRVLLSFVAMALGSNIGLIYTMSKPFASDWTMAPDQFELNAKYMRAFQNKTITNESQPK